ncbi:hypothetical protein NHX12_020128 [Muraenolepis orangiensis]|uniref:Uncharacterized protein n=1 Tax=Muraenolepis orangiensis TaxID=630683 RepID=A0A9Q0IWN8_9TELE|nr:hypothetical protein NHX12_020128 [Muraenolepis orangiensis]
MPPRRKSHVKRPVNRDGRPNNSVDKLAFKYMSMCKVESSTDSESDLSPRWSDTSTMALVTSRQQRRPLQKIKSSLSHKTGFLDPYDGSSEDSDESHRLAGVISRRPRQHGGVCSHYLCRSRRFVTLQPPVPVLQHPVEVQMDSDGSSSELWVCGPDTPWPLVSDRRDAVGGMWSGHNGPEREEEEGEELMEDSGLHSATRSPTPPPLVGSAPHAVVVAAAAAMGSSSPAASGSSDRSSHGCCLYKRKMVGPAGLEMVELGQRKKQCVVRMKEEL